MLTALLAATAVLALLTLVPGPDMAVVTQAALGAGRSAGFRVAAGIVSGLLVWGLLTVLGLSAILAASAEAYTVVKLAGAAYLIYLGVRALWESRTSRMQHNADAPRAPKAGTWKTGFTTNLLNPKATLFFFSVFTQLIDPASSLSQKALIGGIIFIQGVLYWPLVVLALQHPRVIRAIRRVQRSVDRLLGGLLLALGIKVALS